MVATLGEAHPVLFRYDGPKTATLSLGPPESRAGVKLQGTGGPFFFSLRQLLAVIPADDGRHQLRTSEYKYTIRASDGDLAEPLLRWEYVSEVPAGKTWCRHHFQIGRLEQKAVELPFNGGTLDLNRLHTPTGYVLIEYVLRFLLTDMGVTPASDDWERVLTDSEDAFFRRFSERTSQAP